METVLLKSSSKSKMASLIKIAKEMGIDVVTKDEELDKLDEIMGFPGPEVSKAQFEAWLVSEDEVEYTLTEAKKIAKERIAKSRRKLK